MIRPGLPPDEARRLQVLREYQILDTPPEASFDDLTELAAHVTGCPIALVSLVDAERQWFKACVGLEVSETPRELSFCGHVVETPAVLEVPDTLLDERFSDNPLVLGEPFIRYYAGFPLIAPSGHVLGTLCVIDTRPRELSAVERELLCKLARQVVDQIEYRKHNRQLKEEQARLTLYEFFFNSNLDLFCTATLDGYFVELNSSWERVLGWTPEELRAHPFFSLVHPEDQARTAAATAALADGGLVIGFENRYRHKEGRWLWLRWMSQMRDGIIFASARDISAEREQARELREHEAQLRGLFDALQEGVVSQDAQGKITRCNPAAEEILGLSFDQMRGRSSVDPRWYAIRQDGSPFPGEEHPAMEVLRTGRPARGVVMGIHKPSGERTWLLVNSQPLQGGEAGEGADAVVSTFHDITARISAEAQQRAALLESILSCLPGSTLVIFDQELTILERFGRAILESAGSRSSKVSLLGWALSAQRGELEAAARQCLLGQPSRLGLTRGTERFDLQLVPLPGDPGQPSRGLALAYDMSELEQLRELASRQERLATAGTLAAGVGHEINNPLTFVVSNLEFAKEELVAVGGGSPAHWISSILEALSEALEGADRIRKIVRGLRAFAREQGDPAPVNLLSTLEISVNMTRHEIRHRASLQLKLDPVPPVLADEAGLAQVLVNLLVNAAQSFSTNDPSSNKITVQTSVPPDGRVVLSISDNGSGIAPDVLPRIFDPFFTTKPIGKGTGLGLSISNSIIRGFGGELQCETEQGKGTTFRLFLPQARSPQGISSAQRAKVAIVPRVLLIDDEEAVLKATVRMLQSEFEVIALADAREARRRLIAGESFDVICCDLMMPHLSGLELYREIAERSPSVARRFFFISGGATDEDTQAFLRAIPERYLEKPFSLHDLRKALRQVANSPPPPDTFPLILAESAGGTRAQNLAQHLHLSSDEAARERDLGERSPLFPGRLPQSGTEQRLMSIHLATCPPPVSSGQNNQPLPVIEEGSWLWRTLREAVEGRLSGELLLRNNSATGRILLAGGEIAWIHQSSSVVPLRLILERGGIHIDAETCAAVLEECAKSKEHFASVLQSWGLAEPSHVRDCVREFLIEQLARLLAYPKATALFLPAQRPQISQMAFELGELAELPRCRSGVHASQPRSELSAPQKECLDRLANTAGVLGIEMMDQNSEEVLVSRGAALAAKTRSGMMALLESSQEPGTLVLLTSSREGTSALALGEGRALLLTFDPKVVTQGRVLSLLRMFCGG